MNTSGGWFRNGFIYLLILVAIAALFFNIFQAQKPTLTRGINAVIGDAEAGLISRIESPGNNELIITYKDNPGVQIYSRLEPGDSITQLLILSGVPLNSLELVVTQPSRWGDLFSILGGLLPLIFVGVLLFFLIRQAQSGNNQASTMGKSPARQFVGNTPTVTFADVAGVDEAKAELEQIVEFLKEPDKFTTLGARIPKGVLLAGPPGTGKTLLANATACEANAPFFEVSGSEFVEMFVGVGASRIRDLFNTGKRNSPCIIFIDEIDAVGQRRGSIQGINADERWQTLNQILVEMDGFNTDTNIIVIAATSCPEILDPELLRPGRFDRRVTLELPDLAGRQAILAVHARGKPVGDDVNWTEIAKRMEGFSGADIENTMNEAAIFAAGRNRKAITMQDLNDALQKASNIRPVVNQGEKLMA